MNTIKGIIFDLDNTLLDRSKTFLIFSKKLIEFYFTHLSAHDKQELIKQLITIDEDGYKDKKLMFTELREMFPWTIKPTLEELLEFYSLNYASNAELMDGALEVLTYCKKSYKVGLITNGKMVIQYGKLDKLNIRAYFDTIVISEEAGIKKPHKGIFELAMRNLHLIADECIYIGDHPVNDIEGAAQAGLNTIWIKVNQPWRDELTVKPLKTITRLQELLVLF